MESKILVLDPRRREKRVLVLDPVLSLDEEEVEKEGPDRSSQPKAKAKAKVRLSNLPKKEKVNKAKV